MSITIPNIPVDKPIFEGAIATYWMEDGILISLSKSIQRTVPLIQENVNFVKEITENKKMPLLIYLTKSPVPDMETRQFSAEQLPHIYSAMAIISKPGLSQLIMKMVFALKPPTIPMKSFTNVELAKKWLEQYK